MMVRTTYVLAAGMLLAAAGGVAAQNVSATAAFDARAAKHRGGVYFTAADISKRSPARLSDLFRSQSGLTLTTGSDGKVIVTSSRGSRAGMVSGMIGTAGTATPSSASGTVDGGPTVTGSGCTVLVGVDGQLMDSQFSLDDIAVSSVHGVEAYTGSAHVPVEFGNGNNTGCGVIMVWTKTGADKP